MRIVEEHETELADHCVEETIAEWQRLGPTFAPIEIRTSAPGNIEHLSIDINPDDVARVAGSIPRRACQ